MFLSSRCVNTSSGEMWSRTASGLNRIGTVCRRRSESICWFVTEQLLVLQLSSSLLFSQLLLLFCLFHPFTLLPPLLSIILCCFFPFPLLFPFLLPTFYFGLLSSAASISSPFPLLSSFLSFPFLLYLLFSHYLSDLLPLYFLFLVSSLVSFLYFSLLFSLHCFNFLPSFLPFFLLSPLPAFSHFFLSNFLPSLLVPHPFCLSKLFSLFFPPCLLSFSLCFSKYHPSLFSFFSPHHHPPLFFSYLLSSPVFPFLQSLPSPSIVSSLPSSLSPRHFTESRLLSPPSVLLSPSPHLCHIFLPRLPLSSSSVSLYSSRNLTSITLLSASGPSQTAARRGTSAATTSTCTRT